jgi:hypothetical protein
MRKGVRKGPDTREKRPQEEASESSGQLMKIKEGSRGNSVCII